MSNITFGTSGHRGIIGDGFTRDHLLAIAKAIGNYFKINKIYSPRILLGYDTRTGNSPDLEDNSYTYALIHALRNQKITVDFCDNYAPTPLISWVVKTQPYHLGIMLTASHNPPNYNGIKINDKNGAPAPKIMTNWIQDEANKCFEYQSQEFKQFRKQPDCQRVDYTKLFCEHLQLLFKEKFNLPFPDFSGDYIIDTKCGSAIDVWKYLTQNSIGNITWKNNKFSSNFNYELPDPTSKVSIQSIGESCRNYQCVGFSNDPDADRHVLINESGAFVSPEKTAAIIISHFHSNGIGIESVSTTLANSILVKLVCKKLNIPVQETLIGFKYFTPYLTNAFNKNRLAIGVESSGGFSVSYHSYDKCGFLPILLILGIMKKQNKSLVELCNDIDDQFGEFKFEEVAIKLVNGQGKLPISKQMTSNKSLLTTFFSAPVSSVNYDDGLKISFENNDWVLCRPSGTEPLIRVYAESSSTNQALNYIEKIKVLITESSQE